MEERYKNHWDEGMYVCSKCGNRLFSSDAKFNSGTQWPSFRKTMANSVKTRDDYSLGMHRTELVCSKCEEHLGHTRNSIIALYVSGVLSLRKRLLDDTNLIRLTTIFADNHKWNVVEYLCNRVLEFGESKFALRMLAECYEKENKAEKRLEVWERLIRVDYEEADIVKRLAEVREAAGDLEGAIDY